MGYKSKKRDYELQKKNFSQFKNNRLVEPP